MRNYVLIKHPSSAILENVYSARAPKFSGFNNRTSVDETLSTISTNPLGQVLVESLIKG